MPLAIAVIIPQTMQVNLNATGAMARFDGRSLTRPLILEAS